MEASAAANPYGLDGDELQVGFAKLQGARMEYVIQKYTVSMGRCSKTSKVDIVLGDNMNLSRHHADIAYNFDSGESPARVGARGLRERGSRPAYSPLYLRGAGVLRWRVEGRRLLGAAGEGQERRVRGGQVCGARQRPDPAALARSRAGGGRAALLSAATGPQ